MVDSSPNPGWDQSLTSDSNRPIGDAARLSGGYSTSRAINGIALRPELDDITDRADDLLAWTGSTAYPGMLEDLMALGKDMTSLALELAHAAPALEILTGMGCQLYRRAEALAEVNGLLTPDVQDFLPVSSVGKIHFGQRFTERADNTPVPF